MILESILTSVIVLALGGVICKLFYSRLNRLEDKVDWLLYKSGNDYQAKTKRKGVLSNGTTNQTKED